MTAEPITETLPGTEPVDEGEPAGTVAAGGAKPVTLDLMARLARHYTPPSELYPGGVLVPEVDWNGGMHSRRCDAIYVGFTSTSGRLLVGHEVKATRSDWLRELAQPTKADAWESQCHAWYVVAAPGVVKRDELPDGWGLMTPGRARVKLTVDVPARTYPGRQPSWDAVRSVMARWDTLRARQITDARKADLAKARADWDREHENWRQALEEARAGGEHRELVEALCKALRVERIVKWNGSGRTDWIGVDELGASFTEWVHAHRDLHRAAGNVIARWGGRDAIAHAQEQLAAAERALNRIQKLAEHPNEVSAG